MFGIEHIPLGSTILVFQRYDKGASLHIGLKVYILSDMLWVFLQHCGDFQYSSASVFATDPFHTEPLHCTPGAVPHIQSLHQEFPDQIYTTFTLLE